MKKILCLILAAALALSAGGCSVVSNANAADGEPGVLAEPELPAAKPDPDEARGEEYERQYEAWREADRLRRELGADSARDMEDFFAPLLRELLAAEGENRTLSPLNLYLALGMLCEVTDGDTRQEILDLLGEDSAETLRERAERLFRANYMDDGSSLVRLAASVWLPEGMAFKAAPLEHLAREYFASSHQGVMGSPELNAALRGWLNEQTGDRLQDAAGGIATRPETVLALCATVYLRARWVNEFSKEATEPQPFHSPTGDETVDFLHQSGPRRYYWGDKFSAAAQYLDNGCAMWFILPDEGLTPAELLADEEAMAFLLDPGRNEENSKFLTVRLAAPKFDTASNLDLIPALDRLGVHLVCTDQADFSPLTDQTGVFLSDARHAARVTVDEEGVVAAAFTAMMAAGSAMPPEETVDFVLDRPFLYVITGADNVPLFAGTVYHPVG